MSKIKVIDAPCGAGKTSWAIQEINEHPGQLYVYCTPFLDEIERVKTYTGSQRFYEPEYYRYDEDNDTYISVSSKLDSFNGLLLDGKNIGVTHSTFLNATPETIQLIRDNEYILIVDEVLDVICDFNKTAAVERDIKQSLTTKDIQHLIDDGLIQVNPSTGFVKWIGDTWIGGKFSEIEKLIKLGRVYYVREKMMVTVFPPEIFNAFKTVYVMTYMFGTSKLKPYFEKFKIDYELLSVNHVNNTYELCDYNTQTDLLFRNYCSDRITIYGGNDKYLGRNLSKAWFDRQAKINDALKPMSASLGNFFRKIAKAKANKDEIMWTCPKKYYDEIKGQGFTKVRQITAEEKKLPESELKELERKLSCFVPSNAKATNIYRNRWALAYCYNFYDNPMLKGFYTDFSDKVEIDDDALAIGILIQWIFRSRIRDGKDIVIYLPSARMEKLLREWISGKVW